MNRYRHDVQTRPSSKLAMGAILGLLFSGNAYCITGELDDGTKFNSTTNVSWGAQWRADKPLAELIGPAYGGVAGSSVNDDGNLNYRKNDMISNVVKVVSDIEIKKDDFGALFRAKAWYDSALETRSVHHGNSVNGYTNGTLNDHGFTQNAKFSGIDILDAYVYKTFRFAESDLTFRVGKQVLNWGESTFFQGVNQTSPLDVPALRRPGAQIKEGLIPVETVYFNWTPNDNRPSFEGFYQWKFRPFVVDGCGTFFSSADLGIDNSCRAGANLGGALGLPDGSVGYLQHVNNKQARNAGQYGFATHYNIESIDAQVGAFATNLHSGIPIFSAYTSDGVVHPGISQLNNLKYFFEYPESVKRYGLTFATTFTSGWSLGMELSHSPNLPAQINGVDMFYAALGTGLGPLGGKYFGATDGTLMTGYDRVGQTQLLVNTFKLLSPMWGATGGVLLGEFGYQHASISDPKNAGATRYGRSFNYGANIAPLCPSTVPGQCSSDGYATPNSYGYRLYGQLNYTTEMGISVKPGVYFSHDLKGWSVDGQLNEKRKILGLSMRFERAEYWAEASMVTFNRSATYDDGRDRAFYGLSAGFAF